MANKPTEMSKVRQIIKLHFKGIGKKRIAERIGVSKRTAKHYIDFFRTLKITYQETEKLSDLELNNLFHPAQHKPPCSKLEELYAYFPTVEKQLRKTGATLLDQHRQYLQKYPQGYKRTQFFTYYTAWSKKVSPSMVIAHKEGDKMYIDFAGAKLPYVDEHTGEIKQADVFVGILGWSQYAYVEALESQITEEAIAACENSLYYFDGVPLAVVPDNMKSAVSKASRYEPELNENFAAFAAHYGMSVLPARARKPQDKAHVENMVKIVYQRIYSRLNANELLTLAQLNEKIRVLLSELNDAQLTGKNCSRTDQWILERPSLQQLPDTRYEMRKIKQVTVMKHGHVYLTEDQHYYSVPYELIGKKLKMHYSRSKVDLYMNYELIASHKRIRSPHNYSTDPAHLSPQHLHVTEWSPEFFINQAKAIDPVVELFITEVLKKRQHPQQTYKSCQGILQIGKRFTHARLIKACSRAHAIGYYNYKIIEDILVKNLDKYDDDPQPPSMPAHENIRGADYYQ